MLPQRYGRQCAEMRQMTDVFHVFCGKRQKRKDTALRFRSFRRLGSGKPRSKNKEKQPAPLAGGKPTFRLIIWNFDLIYQIQPTQITCLQVCLQYVVTCKCLFLLVLLCFNCNVANIRIISETGKLYADKFAGRRKCNIHLDKRRQPLTSCKDTVRRCLIAAQGTLFSIISLHGV